MTMSPGKSYGYILMDPNRVASRVINLVSPETAAAHAAAPVPSRGVRIRRHAEHHRRHTRRRALARRARGDEHVRDAIRFVVVVRIAMHVRGWIRGRARRRRGVRGDDDADRGCAEALRVCSRAAGRVAEVVSRRARGGLSRTRGVARGERTPVRDVEAR